MLTSNVINFEQLASDHTQLHNNYLILYHKYKFCSIQAQALEVANRTLTDQVGVLTKRVVGLESSNSSLLLEVSKITG